MDAAAVSSMDRLPPPVSVGAKVRAAKPTVASHEQLCAICDKPVVKPFAPPCGHVACYLCWNANDSPSKQCPSCGCAFKKKQLKVQYF
jgi:hypothetical protein